MSEKLPEPVDPENKGDKPVNLRKDASNTPSEKPKDPKGKQPKPKDLGVKSANPPVEPTSEPAIEQSHIRPTSAFARIRSIGRTAYEVWDAADRPNLLTLYWRHIGAVVLAGALIVGAVDEEFHTSVADEMASTCVNPDAILPVQLYQETVNAIGVEAGGKDLPCPADEAPDEAH